MITITNIDRMQRTAEEWRSKGETIGFVPTMGFFHEGHLELMRRGRKECSRLVVSIFVNPTQFGQGEDFEAYPRNTDRDSSLARELDVDVLFIPSAQDMYPRGYQTYVQVEELTKGLCGASRPGHFRGVATVVTKLVNLVKPHYAYFGEKDYQQLITIKRLVSDLNIDTMVVSCPTVREEDGLAMSSRNAYLSPQGRKAALCLHKALAHAQERSANGEGNTGNILEETRKIIEEEPLARIDYVTVCDPWTLEDVKSFSDTARLVMAVRVEKTRLIDNGLLIRKGSET